MIHEEITSDILKSFYKVFNTLGYGFLEHVYENALALELVKQGCSVVQQKRISVYYQGALVGDYYADLLVNDAVIVELKAAEILKPEHFAQLTNYLKGTDKEVGLLLNFGKKPDFKRIIFSNCWKGNLQAFANDQQLS